ncbi:MAG TPA: protocatechuate 3,4-dioxygenase subunit alpha [Gaiellaceae bacterium]|jgi:protocatechuate 3,4-dioxygenase alpha subunit|nr:protocatechuate 3,4-dioxygenase subunit alpha [Gaiellaceae bacterium]
MTLPLTPSQTVGPFFSIGLARRTENELVPKGSDGAILLEGHVLDADGTPVPDAMVEIWQADPTGTYETGFGWGRSGTDAQGFYSFVTVKPGSVDGQAPHLSMLVFMRGLLKPVLTRVYFSDEAEANAADPVLVGVAEEARSLLVAIGDGGVFRLDVRMQGENETPFFTL